MNTCTLTTPIGPLQLISSGSALVAIHFPGHHQGEAAEGTEDPVLACARVQLQEYFAGQRRHFDLPLAAAGTDFQRQVWAALAKIPYGESRSYREIARAIGRDRAVRAVGAANGRNPLPIVVPCHRVIGSDGSLTGFAGGMARKQWLLELEQPQRNWGRIPNRKLGTDT